MRDKVLAEMRAIAYKAADPHGGFTMKDARRQEQLFRMSLPPRVPAPNHDWGKRLPLGTRVYDVHDARHVGRLDAVHADGDHRVTFDNGTRADVPLRRVRVAPEGH